MDEEFCANESLAVNTRNMKIWGKVPMGNYAPEIGVDAKPADFSICLQKTIAMEHMSFSGIGNAYSVANTMSYILFSGEILNEEFVKHMVSEDSRKFDMMLGEESVFTKGGVNHWKIQGIDWYGWGGWGMFYITILLSLSVLCRLDDN